MARVFLKKDRDYTVRHRHPWVFSGAVGKVEGEAAPGETVTVCSADGDELGYGAWSPESQIRIRMWSFGTTRQIDGAFFRKRVDAALAMRTNLRASGCTDAMRVINAEADGLPGVTVDRYADWYVCQFTSAGAEKWKNVIAAALQAAWPARGVFERSDSDLRKYEGMEPSCGPLSGEEPPETIEILENGCRFLVDVRGGHKTGFYLDQRDNRSAIAGYAAGLDVLNVFSYTGGFGVAAMKGGAKSVTHLDLSVPALDLARRNTELNGGNAEFIAGNAFEVLRKFRDSRRSFDLIVLDPPKFADSKKHLMGACRGYKDINLLAMKLLRPGGYLATFSCSGLITPDIFQKVISEAAFDSGQEFSIIRRFQQSADHPESVFFPEGLYLKGLLLKAGGI